MEPSVKLVSCSTRPIETIYHLWEASRSQGFVMSPDQIFARTQVDPVYAAEVRKLFERVVDSAIPVAENIWFVFMLENVSVSFREQMVRHRIGVKVGERMGVDFFPDLHESTWWSQSMRVLDMGEFARNGAYRMPPKVAANQKMRLEFESAMSTVELAYNRMIAAGIPAEDAREVLPLGATHRISWGLNLGAIQHILKKRGCWILQLGLWEPIIRGMVEEMATKIDPYFRNLIAPPCVKGNDFIGCNVKLDNQKRIKREDPLPPCSLYLHQEEKADAAAIRTSVGEDRLESFGKMEAAYEKLWGRDCRTGALTPETKTGGEVRA